MPKPDPELPALGVRQPWAELIVSGRKSLEIRSRPTRVRGTIYIYSSKKVAEYPAAAEAAAAAGVDLSAATKGRIVGTVELTGCRPTSVGDARASCVPAEMLRDRYAWEFANPVRFEEPLRVRFLPYGVWFYPFRPRSG